MKLNSWKNKKETEFDKAKSKVSLKTACSSQQFCKIPYGPLSIFIRLTPKNFRDGLRDSASVSVPTTPIWMLVIHVNLKNLTLIISSFTNKQILENKLFSFLDYYLKVVKWIVYKYIRQGRMSMIKILVYKWKISFINRQVFVHGQINGLSFEAFFLSMNNSYNGEFLFMNENFFYE